MKSLKILLSILTLAVFSNSIFAQKLDYAAGELIIQHDLSTQANQWLKKANQKNDILAHLDYKKSVSASLNIHLYSFDETAVNESILLNEVRKTDGIVLSQFNHFLELRQTIPDDPQFVDQWQYINTGQDGGTIGADIDTDLAWDIAKGGLTPEGDTIVVCVIDGGFQITHPDLADNVWYNYAEIPNNGIDDDNNGFVDDFKGWSTNSGTDNVDSNPTGHGTPVAGIVGAKGNNGIGVAGVNWDVKLMLVQGGSGVESEVIEAYGYALEARIRYNETDGAEGAFVVSTNASWGTDFGQPADAPIWCSMYDSLGVHGIISCGATINSNQDVDLVGDLPTGCPSDFLISVTNMDRNDEKVTGAGFGLETIDLGAFGAGTWTLENGSSYGGFGGTSGATPHVTGTIALLYSAPCSNLTTLAKADPAAAALQVKDLILENGDDNPSLQGITTTGKRLNVNNAMLMLMNNCGPCPTPVGLSANNVTDVNATVDWTTNQNSILDTLKWREQGTVDWNVIVPATSPTDLNDLLACTFYEVQAISNCDTISSDYSNIVRFKTDGCCELPTEISTSDVLEESASIAWNSILAAQSYNVRYREVSTTDWTEITGIDMTTAVLENLIMCANYEYQVQTVCENELLEYGESITFQTKGCGACLDLEYCLPVNLDTSDEWIASFSVGDINNVSGPDNLGYGDYTASEFTTTFETFGTYEFTLTPDFTGFQFDENIRIWIDLDGNGEFSDAELLFEDENVTMTYTGEFQIPADASFENVRMRVGLYFNDVLTPCPNDIFAEVEDYCVSIVEGIPQCSDVTNIQIDPITQTTALVSWAQVNSADNYLLRYKAVSEATWTEMSYTTISNNLDNLIQCTNYEVQIKSVCSFGESDYSESQNFMTICETNTEDASSFTAVQVFPSPFDDNLNLTFETDQLFDNITVSLLNELGQIVLTEDVNNTSNQSFNMQMETNDIPEGLYFLQLQSGLNNKIIKVVKTNK